jgi:hypothetical protein
MVALLIMMYVDIVGIALYISDKLYIVETGADVVDTE